MAALVSFQLGWGWWMGRQPVGGDKADAYAVHYAVGVLMLLLALGRIGWRLLAPGPINDADKPGWQGTAGRITHHLFYACLFLLPLTGWAMVSATAPETELTAAGVVAWPLLPLRDLSNSQVWAIEAIAEWLHAGLIVTLVLLIPIHVAGALKHHLVDQDDVLHAMLPVLKAPKRRASRWRLRYRAAEKLLRRLASRRWRRPPAADEPLRRG